MGKLDRTQQLIWLGRIALAIVFISAALPKIIDPFSFATSVEAYRVVTGDFTNWVALLLPWFELFIAIGLLTRGLQLASMISTGTLLLLFIALHVSAWARGLDISCGCFGASNESIGYPWLVARNFGLLVVVVFLWKLQAKRVTLEK